ncbi:hypothetical protein BH23VER1_BH23VER1_04950 [soil metagenome]
MPLDTYIEALRAGDFTAGLVLLFAFLIGHALGDHPLQGDYIALNKSRYYRPHTVPAGQSRAVVWPHCLAAHCLIHGGLVWMISGSVVLALVEFVLHGVIDFAKCEGWTNYHFDQALHVLCKVGFVVALALVPSL